MSPIATFYVWSTDDGVSCRIVVTRDGCEVQYLTALGSATQLCPSVAAALEVAERWRPSDADGLRAA